MKFRLSYFYQVRFFSPNMIPISTAHSDPSWYHKNSGKNYTFFDKNDVINGLRCEELSPGSCCEGLCNGNRKNCSPDNCEFLKTYKRQLDTHFSISNFIDRCAIAVENVRKYNHFKDEPIIVLLVHEAPDNPCSERRVLIDFFSKNKIPIKEWNKDDNIIN